jgi:hypothetical protein
MKHQCALILIATVIGFGACAQQLEWATTVTGTAQQVATAAAVDGAGAVITVGYFVNSVDLDPGPGTFIVSTNGNSADIYIQKLDVNGQFQWGASLGSTGADAAPGVVVDGNNNIILTGKISGTVDLDPGPGIFNVTTSNSTFDVLVLKLDAAGNFLWGTIFGGNSNDAGMSIATDASGNIYTTGVLGGSADLDPGPGTTSAGGAGLQDVYVQKLDPSGSFVWGFSIGGVGNDLGHGIDVSASGMAYITGEYSGSLDLDPGPGVLTATSAGSADIFIIKLNANGGLDWGHHIGGNSFEVARDIAVSDIGGVVITGQLNSVTDMDPGPGVATLPGSGFEDAFVLKLDTTGSYKWAFLLGSFLNIGTGIGLDAQGNVVTCGSFGGTLDVDPGPGVSNIVSNGASDVYLLRYDSTGSLLQGFNIGGPQNDEAHGVALDQLGPIAMVGEFRSTMDADPGPGNVPLVSLGGQSAFTVKYDGFGCDSVLVGPRVLLDGAYSITDALMIDSLRVQGLLPLTEPYTALGFPVVQPQPTNAAVLAVAGPDAVVDWVLVELRDATQPTSIISTKAALLQRDGDVVDVDGISPVSFCEPGVAVHVAVRHRNHLGVMTAGSFSLSSTSTLVDLTDPVTTAFGTAARKTVGGTSLLWAGNVLMDDLVKYTGVGNDRDPILVSVGGAVPTATASGYQSEDVNLDGIVKYMGAANDRDLVLLTIGGTIPTAVRMEQLP